MKNFLSNLFFKMAVRLIKWSVKLEPLQKTGYSEDRIYSYKITYTMEDGTIVTKDGPVSVSEMN